MLITFTWVITITILKICKHFLYAQYIQFPNLPVASNFPVTVKFNFVFLAKHPKGRRDDLNPLSHREGRAYSNSIFTRDQEMWYSMFKVYNRG